jgi:hypothetical protein
MHPDEVHDAVASGQYSFPKGSPIQVFDPNGQLGTLDPHEAPEAFNAGYRYAMPQAIDDYKNSSLGEQAKAFVEGAGQGVVGPLAPAAEEAIGIDPENIQRRSHTGAHTAGEVTGLVGSSMADFGLSAGMEAAGHAAQAAAGLSDVAKGVDAAAQATKMGLPELAKAFQPSYLSRVGSEAAKQAAEMAVLGGSDEISKMVVQDPDATATNAISNVGLSAALGLGGGALMAGAVSPLWKAGPGPKAAQWLEGLIKTVNGGDKLVLPETLQKSFADLGISPHPTIVSALSGDPKALEMAQELYRAQNPQMLEQLNNLPVELRESVAKGLGINLDDAATFSNHDSGKAIEQSFKDRLLSDYGPVHDEQERVAAQEATVAIPDEDALNLRNTLIEHAATNQDIGTASPLYKTFHEVGDQVLTKDTVGGLEALRQQLRRRASGPIDDDTRFGLNRLRSLIGDWKNNFILKQGEKVGLEGMDQSVVDYAAQAQARATSTKALSGVGSGARRIGEDLQAEADQASQTAKQAVKDAKAEGRTAAQGLIDDRKVASSNYQDYVEKYEKLMDHLGLGDWKGTGKLQAKLEKLTPEEIIKKFSTKGDVELKEILQQTFPDIAEMVRQHEAKQFLSGAVYRENGKVVLDSKALVRKLDNLMKGSPEHAKFILPNGAIERIRAGDVIQDGISRIKAIKDSGTPAGMWKLFKHVGSGAGAMIGGIAGGEHGLGGGVIGGLVGGMATHFGKELPEAYKLAMLNIMSSEAEVSAPGVKSMVNFLGKAYKGAQTTSKAVSDVLRPTAQVLGSKIVATTGGDEKIDKLVEEFQKDPNKFASRVQNSDLGHYMGAHQVALSQQSTQAIQYLAQLKPKPLQLGPLDKPIKPSAQASQRYNRAVGIAQQPLSVLQHVKDGTLLPSDIQDLNSMYPGYMQQLQTKLGQEIAGALDEETPIPYHTRLGLSLFLGQPLDNTMQPMSIIAAQPQPVQAPQAPQGKKPSAKASTDMAKGAKSYQTASQSAESDRSGRDS